MILISVLNCLIPVLFTFIISRFLCKKNLCIKQVAAIDHQFESSESVKISSETRHQKPDINTTLIETSAAFFVVIDFDGKIVTMNRCFLRVLGYTLDEISGTDYLSTVIPENEREFLAQVFRDVPSLVPLQTLNQPIEQESRVLTKDGRKLLVEWRIQPKLKTNGKLDCFCCTGIDITQRRQLEEQLHDSRERYFRLVQEQTEPIRRFVADGNPNPIVEINLAGQVLYLNPKAMQLWSNLKQSGVQHPFLAGILSRAKVLQQEGSLQREVKIDQVYYEQVLHYVEEISCFRIYAFDITERKQAEAQLVYNAFYDQLTGLANRALFMDRLKRAFRVAKHYRRSSPLEHPYLLAVLFLDLNRFKLVNDSLGNKVGDQLLQSFASRIETCLRPTDTLARLEGDEFAILLEGIEDLTQATCVADAIYNTLSSPFYLDKSEVFMSVSIGIALSTASYIHMSTALPLALVPTTPQRKQPEEALGNNWVVQPEDLLRNASIAMYRAKAEAQSYYAIFDSTMYSHAVDRLQLETDLRRAIERQEFRVYYQPIVSLATSKIIGFEALLRWQHPQRGLVYPTEFIPTAEETGLISPMDWWTLRQACHQMKLWQEEFKDIQPLSINVNLSCQQFTQPDLIQQIDNILQETELSASSLKLEITESEVMENPDLVRNWLLQLKQRQINLCIDDFGTGYSSLSRLDNFPINTLKIDRSFVSRMGAPGKNAEIIQAIVNLAQTLNIEVVAEGIEVSEQANSLLALQCEYGQGYLFSKPVDSDAARKLLMDGVNHFN